MREADRSHCRSRCAPSTSSGWPAILRTTPESQVRTRLPAGGNRIRTIGPAVEETPFPTPDVSFRANGSDLRHSLRGTEGSNPLPSNGESGANLIFGANAIDGRRGCPASIGWDRINRLAEARNSSAARA